MYQRWPIGFYLCANSNQLTVNNCLECYIKELCLGMAEELSAMGMLLGAAYMVFICQLWTEL